MKNFKRIASLVLALTMVLCMGLPIFADATTEHTITIENTKSGHTYEAYQIFKGNISDGKLVEIAWGSGVDGAALLTALKASTVLIGGADTTDTADDVTFGSLFTAAATAEDVANVISAETFTADKVDIFAQIVGTKLATVAGTSTATQSPYTISVAGDGYYLVKDMNDSLENTTEDAYTKYILQVLNDVTVTAKADAPELTKKIIEDNEPVDANATKGIGDTVEYQLKSVIPDMDGYNKYFFVVHDTMSSGLTFDATSVVVKIDEETLAADTDYTIVTDCTDDCTFEIVFKDFIQYKDQKGVSHLHCKDVICDTPFCDFMNTVLPFLL